MKLKEKVDFLINKLEEIYPTLEIPLDHKDPYTLLIAVLLSAQSCNLNDNYSKLTSQGYEVIGVSPDTVDKQNKFADKFGFKYNLLADDSRELIDAFGVWGKKKFRGNEYEGVLRTTFIIDEEGVIERVIDKVNTKDHADQILD